MLIWQTWAHEFTNAEGFWGTWDLLEHSGLPTGCYWVIPSGVTATPVGQIQGYDVASGSAALIDNLLPEWAERGVHWFLVRGGEAYSIGFWGLEPAFLEPEVLYKATGLQGLSSQFVEFKDFSGNTAITISREPQSGFIRTCRNFDTDPSGCYKIFSTSDFQSWNNNHTGQAVGTFEDVLRELQVTIPCRNFDEVFEFAEDEEVCLEVV